MPPGRLPLKPYAGKEIPISVLEMMSREEMLWISRDALPIEFFPPCIRNIIQKTEGEKSSHRTAAILAAFLGQAGWGETEAKEMWVKVASVEERIFTEWFGKMHCPKCETLKRESDGYPDLGIADLGCCQPDEKCPGFGGPVEYAALLKVEEDRSRGTLKHIKTLHLACIFDWASGKEGEIELSGAEKDELESLLKEQKESETLVYTCIKVRGRLRPKFSLKVSEGPKRRFLSELI
jgi:hypothetical protein